jgi:hypothetical protein
MQTLAALCVRRPVFAAMLILSMSVVGAVSFFLLGLDRFPNVDLPVVTVTTAVSPYSRGALKSASRCTVGNPRRIFEMSSG